MEIQTSKGTWTIHGINLTPSDSHYELLKEAIESDSLSEKHLQGITGYHLPVFVNRQERTIEFSKF